LLGSDVVGMVATRTVNKSLKRHYSWQLLLVTFVITVGGAKITNVWP